jgi:hypothetical protein
MWVERDYSELRREIPRIPEFERAIKSPEFWMAPIKILDCTLPIDPRINDFQVRR